ncbi:META domain-containing protein [Agromyces sp. SYSU K20354]|uniref:META domain-containing protein n=1 Tax=Agromyces cavernae TaxID=2898659 RepID=UPI001E3C546C|nr:META domain-containing protein [Agromyces cavernae]MCD2440900.1 META domain-containing protein [Agromyces cavernae]
MRRRPFALAVALLLVALGAGCASDPVGESQPSVAQPSAAPSATGAVTPGGSEPIELIGLWRVSGAAGESDQTWLRLEAGQFQLWRECGMLDGAWRAGERAFVASVHGGSGECIDGSLPEIPWLDSVTSYEPAETGWRLVDDTGAVMASLAIDGAPEPIPTAAEFYTEPPVIDEGVRAAFRDAAPLPETLEPATATELHGRWTPVDAPGANDAHVEFQRSGVWAGSDGCNGSGGRWTIADEGDLLATSGPSTLIGCDNIQVPGWIGSAHLAGFDGDELVLLDVTGSELGRLQRAD